MPGQWLFDLEERCLHSVLSRCYGRFALQIGGPAHTQLLSHARIDQRRLLVMQPRKNHHLKEGCASIWVDWTELCFAPNSIDLVLIVHALEFLGSPRQLLSQIYQCLAPQGQVVILGFSPHSLWGLTRHIKGHRGLPWCGHFYPAERILYWLSAIGYGDISQETLCHQGPITHQRSRRISTAFELFGQVLWPGLGSVYCIQAQKQICSVTPIKASGWARKAGAANPCVS